MLRVLFLFLWKKKRKKRKITWLKRRLKCFPYDLGFVFPIVHHLEKQMGLVNAASRLDFPFLYSSNSFLPDKNLTLSFYQCFFFFFCTSLARDRETTVSLSITAGLLEGWGARLMASNAVINAHSSRLTEEHRRRATLSQLRACLSLLLCTYDIR